MADHELIGGYVEAVRSRLSWRGDADDVCDELVDHLLCAAHACEAAGVPAADAQQEVIAGFGDPSTVALSFASSGTKGPALPTDLTRSAGVIAQFGAAAWCVLAIAWYGTYAVESATGNWEGIPFVLYLIGTVALIAAAVLQGLLLYYLDRRHGGLGLLGLAGVGVTALGAVATLVSWFVPGWATLLALGFILTAVPVLVRGLVPRWPFVVVMVAWPAAWATYLVLDPLKFGRIDSYGDYPLAFTIAVAAGALVTAVGQAMVGRNLSTETPADAGLVQMAVGRQV